MDSNIIKITFTAPEPDDIVLIEVKEIYGSDYVN